MGGLVGGGAVHLLGDDRDLVARGGQRLGQGVHVPTQSAVDERRVLPGQLQHAHSDARLAADGRSAPASESAQRARVEVREGAVVGPVQGRQRPRMAGVAPDRIGEAVEAREVPGGAVARVSGG